jgi:hypothetical protein
MADTKLEARFRKGQYTITRSNRGEANLLHEFENKVVAFQGTVLTAEIVEPLAYYQIGFSQLSEHMLHCFGCEHLHTLPYHMESG